MRKITVAAQDDCAPDALPVFAREFEKETGMTISEFQKKAQFVDDFMLKWALSGYELSISPDDPYYRLVKVTG